MNAIHWTDVAPRDGLQNIDAQVATEVKVRLVRGLLDAGVDRVEAAAMVSPRWVPQMADGAEVLAAFGEAERRRLRCLIPNLRGMERAIDSGVTNVLVTIAATDGFNRRNVNRSVAESLDELSAITAAGSARGVAVDVAVSVAFGCPFEGHVEPSVVVDLCRRLRDLGVADIGIADTIGVARPAEVGHMVEALVAAGLDLAGLSLHVHDTRGQGVANVVAAYHHGIRRFDGSAGGLGGCPFAPRSTGNVTSEDALLALAAEGAVTSADLERLCAVSEQLARDLGRDLPGKLYRAGIWHPAASPPADGEG